MDRFATIINRVDFIQKFVDGNQLVLLTRPSLLPGILGQLFGPLPSFKLFLHEDSLALTLINLKKKIQLSHDSSSVLYQSIMSLKRSKKLFPQDAYQC